jgi:hypothetical protein
MTELSTQKVTHIGNREGLVKSESMGVMQNEWVPVAIRKTAYVTG